MDIHDIKKISGVRRKELRLTEQDQRYFEGAKGDPFGKRVKDTAGDRFAEEKKRTEDPLSKKIEEYFGLREKRKRRLENKRKMLEMKQTQNEQRVAKLMEQNIIDDIGVNFLFRRGTGLKDSLIDIDRAFNIVSRVENIISANT